MIFPKARRRTRRSLSAAASLLLAGSLIAGATEAKKKPEPPLVTSPEVKDEIAGYLRLAVQAADAEKWPLAEHFLQLIVDLPAAESDKKAPYLEMAGAYEKRKILSKAIAVYEKMLLSFPQDADVPATLLKLGLMYREAGARQLAISRFYSVLNSALKVDGSGLDDYRLLTRQAQWEIAETYYQAGEYEQARKFCRLLLRLELEPEEKAKVMFRLTHCSYLVGDMPGTIISAQGFLKEYPTGAQSPEARYLLATALRAQRRAPEAFDTVLDLLRAEKERSAEAPEKWRFWQKKTGNEFANEYYQQGDFLNALTIYQSLAKLSDEPDWQWPVIYQLGLCFERLRLPPRAAEAYKYLVDESKKPGREPEKLSEGVRGLPEMARWRGEQLAWRSDTESRLEHLLGQPTADAPQAATR